MKLIKPSVEYRDTFIDGLKEYQSEGGFPTVDAEERRDKFAEYIDRLSNDYEKGYGDGGIIHTKHLWLVDGYKYIGTTLLSHQIDEDLLNFGGNISYEIRPTERRKGYGKEILRLALLEAKRIGLERIRMVCDEDNIASKKIIEENGGVQEDTFFKKGMRVKS